MVEAGCISGDDLFQVLSSLRISIKNDLDSSIGDLLYLSSGTKSKATTHFSHLRPLLTITNCGLLQFLIRKFGDAKLKQEVDAYTHEVEIFMKETTVSEVMNIYFSDEPHANYSELKIEFNESPNLHTLERLSNFKAQFCNSVCQSEFAFGLKLIEQRCSCVSTTWLIPSLIVSKLKESAKSFVDETFYQRENITLMSLEGLNDPPQLLYSKV